LTANPEITPGLSTVNSASCPASYTGTYTNGTVGYAYDVGWGDSWRRCRSSSWRRRNRSGPWARSDDASPTRQTPL